MDEYARTWQFECAMQDRCARTRREFEYGTALFNDRLRRVYDTNFVRFERGFDELTGEVVAALADELQASLRHRKVMIADEAAGARVAEELKERGWRYYTLVTMAYRGPRERDAVSAASSRSTRAPCAARADRRSRTARATPRRATRSSRSPS